MACAAWLRPLAPPVWLGEWGLTEGLLPVPQAPRRGFGAVGGRKTYWRRRSLEAAAAVCWRKYGGSRFKTARGADYRRHRPGRRLSRRISAWPWLYRAWHQAALVLIQHGAHRSSLRGSPRRQRAISVALRRHD